MESMEQDFRGGIVESADTVNITACQVISTLERVGTVREVEEHVALQHGAVNIWVHVDVIHAQMITHTASIRQKSMLKYWCSLSSCDSLALSLQLMPTQTPNAIAVQHAGTPLVFAVFRNLSPKKDRRLTTMQSNPVVAPESWVSLVRLFDIVAVLEPLELFMVTDERARDAAAVSRAPRGRPAVF